MLYEVITCKRGLCRRRQAGPVGGTHAKLDLHPDSGVDSDKSIIYDVAENRLHTEKAILALLLGGYR